MTEASTNWLTPGQAAAHVRCSTSHLLRCARRGVVVGYRMGHRWRFREVDLNNWIEASRQATPIVLYRPARQPKESE